MMFGIVLSGDLEQYIGEYLQALEDAGFIPEGYVPSNYKIIDLLKQAKTARQLVFARYIRSYNLETSMVAFPKSKFEISPRFPKTLRYILAACKQNPECYTALKKIPFVGTMKLKDPQLHDCLQDLANLVAWEASEAFTARYYPGVPNQEVIHPDHVEEIMAGLQREMDREGARVKLTPGKFIDLPWERQVALAERRRYWYGRFGITPRAWKSGFFSLWNVNGIEKLPPEGYYCRYDSGEVRNTNPRRGPYVFG